MVDPRVRSVRWCGGFTPGASVAPEPRHPLFITDRDVEVVDAHFWQACLVAGVVTAALIAALRPVAGYVGLVDHPNDRKHHQGTVPLIGGLAMFGGIVAGTVYFGHLGPFRTVVLETAAVMAFIGALDDRHDLSVRVRVLAQLACVTCVMVSTGVHISSLGHLFGAPIELGPLGYVFTAVAVIGLLNAFNMMDGIDGLAGSQALVSVCTLLAFHHGGAASGIVAMLALVASAAVPYLVVNLGFTRRKVFLGDAGSMLVGYLLSWALIRLSELDTSPVRPTDVLWCVAVPVLDTVTVMARRIAERKSPFKPDRSHVHHMLVARGFSPRRALAALTVLSCGISAIGVTLHRLPGETNLLVFAVVAIAYVTLVTREYKRQQREAPPAIAISPPALIPTQAPALVQTPEPAIAD